MRRLLDMQNVEVVGEGENGEQAVRLAKSMNAEMLFLDINMPVQNGLEAAAQIAAEVPQPPTIVFCTAYDEYALEAFKTNASAYLLKPVNATDLAEVIERSGRLTRLQANQADSASAALARQPVLAIVSQHGIENIELAKISHFRSIDKHVFANILGRGEVLVDYTLKELQSMFNSSLIRTHRSALANISYLTKVQRSADGTMLVGLRDVDVPLPVSRRHLAAVKKCFQS